MKRLLAILSCCMFAASCQKAHTVVSNPLAPSLPTRESPANPPLYPPDSWALSASITSVTPHRCWRDLTGLTHDYALDVRRAETMRLFVYWDPTDGIEYVGSASGQDFSLAGRFNHGNWFNLGCASGGPLQVTLTGHVSGRFTDDGRSMSAEEVLSYRVAGTGEQVDVRFRWTATAPALVTPGLDGPRSSREF